VKEGAAAGRDRRRVGGHDGERVFAPCFARGKLSERTVEVEFQEAAAPVFDLAGFGGGAPEGMEGNLQEMLSGLFPKRTRRERDAGRRGARFPREGRGGPPVDTERVKRMAVERTEQSGIVFLDEIDRSPAGNRSRAPTYRARASSGTCCPVVEGSAVPHRSTGVVRTDHILFVRRGAFHVNKPSDLIPGAAGALPDPGGAVGPL